MNRILTLALACAVGACSTDHAKTAAVTDAGPPAPAPVVDAGAAPAHDARDAGMAATVHDAGAAAVASDSAASEREPAGKATAFDRVLAKPKDAHADPDALKALVEKKLGVRVLRARKSAGKWVLFEVAPAPGGRDAAAQKKLVDALKEMDAFETVEGDRLMKIK